jgi:hypothetical protein
MNPVAETRFRNISPNDNNCFRKHTRPNHPVSVQPRLAGSRAE